MKALPKSNKTKALNVTKMTDLTTLLYNNLKLAICTGGDIHGIYCYLEIIESPTTLTTSGQRSHHFGP